MTEPTTTDIERLLRAIAPADLQGVPVYACLASTMPPKLRPIPNVRGLFGKRLDVSLKSWLTDCGRWQGRGVAIVLNDIGMQQDARETYPSNPTHRAELYRWLMFATSVHELTHALEAPIDTEEPPPEFAEPFTTMARVTFEQHYALTGTPGAEPIDPPPSWIGHGPGFMRILALVHHRAESVVGNIPCWLLYRPGGYGLSSFCRYRHALESELTTGKTFAELRTTRPPESFVELAKGDIQHWWASNGSRPEDLTHVVTTLAPYTVA